jgi:GT2 family glycosyltransferase
MSAERSQLTLTEPGMESSVQRSLAAATHQTHRVAIVLVNWNNSDDTLACIESLNRLNYEDSQVVVVDNYSGPDQFGALRSRCSNEIILRQKRNLGFAGGCNVGIRWALQNGFDYVWLLNSDAVVASESLSKLVDAMESDPRIGIVGGVMYYWSDPQRIQMAGGFMNPLSARGEMLGLNELDAGQFRGIKDVDYVSGGMLLVRSEAIKQVGLLDERFFLYYEDTDWGVRMRDRGWRVVTAAEAKLWHKNRDSAGTKKPYFLQHGYFMFLYKNSRHHLPQALRLYARHYLRPHLAHGEWGLAWADVKVYWKFLARLAFVRANLQP